MPPGEGPGPRPNPQPTKKWRALSWALHTHPDAGSPAAFFAATSPSSLLSGSYRTEPGRGSPCPAVRQGTACQLATLQIRRAPSYCTSVPRTRCPRASTTTVVTRFSFVKSVATCPPGFFDAPRQLGTARLHPMHTATEAARPLPTRPHMPPGDGYIHRGRQTY